tara:strand:+ start:209 stop:397 length:189 start_codon:yes stop_codon:yes gene_type:complete
MKISNKKPLFITLGFISLGFLSSILFLYDKQELLSGQMILTIVTISFATMTAFAMAFNTKKS